MKWLVFATVLVAVAFSEEDIKLQFNGFVQKYNKVYTSEDEYNLRYSNFKASLERVEKLQLASSNTVFGVTKFSDMSVEEFKFTILMAAAPKKSRKVGTVGVSIADKDTPTVFDWRDHDGVTPVKDQGSCGSCWAFSATEVINAGGLEAEESYPYTAIHGKCMFKIAEVVAQISDFTSVSTEESALPTNLYNLGPLSICLAAEVWQDYTSGVMTAKQCCPEGCAISHCVQLVGFNTTASKPYWIVRNSWNTDWGIDGYIYLEMYENTCAITNDPNWPLADSN